MASWWDELWEDTKKTVSKVSDTVFNGGQEPKLQKQQTNRDGMAPQPKPKTIPFEASLPVGMQQGMQRGTTFLNGGKQEQKSKEAKQAAQFLEGERPAPGVWFTGQNKEGTSNGWDTEFVKLAEENYKKHEKDGTLLDRGEDENFTGVVTWGEKGKLLQQREGGRQTMLGDIYAEGVKIGNAYEELDEQTANVLLSQWMLSNDEQRRIFGASDYKRDLEESGTSWRLQEAIANRARASHEDLIKGMGAQDFQRAVDERQSDESVAWTTLGAAALGGAGLGSVAGPWGMVIGAGLGVGSALLNWDSRTEATASAFQRVEEAKREFGLRGAIPQAFSGVGGVGQEALNPVGSAFEGTYNILHGDEWGDGESQFREAQAKGELSALAQTGYWASSFVSFIPVGGAVVRGVRTGADNKLRFAAQAQQQRMSNWAPQLYMGTMNAAWMGEGATLITTGGHSFDDRRGGFDKIYQDDQGNFDPTAMTAGVMSLSIDAVQANLPAFLRVGYKGPTAAGRVQAGGWTVQKDAAGNIIANSQRRNLASYVAPSERIGAQNTSRLARRRAAADNGRSVTAEDYYTAAQQLAQGKRPFDTVLLTAFGEGTEEAIQAVLEPISHRAVEGDWATAGISGQSIVQAFLQGSAMGGGMAMGSVMGGRVRANSAYQLGNAQYKIENGILQDEAGLSQEEFENLPESEQARLSALGGVSFAQLTAAMDAVTANHTHSLTANVTELAIMENILYEQVAVKAGKVWKQNPDATRRGAMYRSPGELNAQGWVASKDIPDEAKVMSSISVALDLQNYRQALQQHHEGLQQRIEDLKDTADADQIPDLQETLNLLNTLFGDVTTQRGATPLADAFLNQLAPLFERKDAEAVQNLRRQILRAFRGGATINGLELTDEQKAALQYLVSLPTTRYPQDKSGSFQLLVPLPNEALTAEDAHGVAMFSPGVLKAFSMDFDGDKSNAMFKALVTMGAYRNARSGSNFYGAGSTVDIDILTGDKQKLMSLAESLQGRVQSQVDVEGQSVTIQTVAANTVDSLIGAIRQRLSFAAGPELEKHIEQFRLGLASMTPHDAVLEFITDVGRMDKVQEVAATELTNMPLELIHGIRTYLNRFNNSYAETVRAETPTRNQSAERKSTRIVGQGAGRGMVQSATFSGTVQQELRGDSALRNWMQIHFTSYNSAVEKTAPKDIALGELTAIYEALSRAESLDAAEMLDARGEIQARVFDQLRHVGRTARHLSSDTLTIAPDTAMVTFAGLEVTENGKTMTVAQWLLQQGINRTRHKNAQALQYDTQLTKRLAKLEAMTANNEDARAQALLETVGYQPLGDVLRDFNSDLNRSLTAGQIVRDLVNRSSDHRSQRLRTMKLSEAYQKNPAEKLIVDAIALVANKRLSLQKDGSLVGELQEQSERASGDIQTAVSSVQNALKTFLRMEAKQGVTYATERDALREMLSRNPVALQALITSLPSKAAALAIDVNNKTVAPWFYDALLEPNTTKAEKVLWWNSVFGSWLATKGARAMNSETQSFKYESLQTRTHRAMYRLAASSNPRMMQEFVEIAENSESIDDVLRWLNFESGAVLGAPVTAWTDDVAETDADQARGGWGVSYAGSDQREAFRAMRSSFEQLSADLLGKEDNAKLDMQMHMDLARDLEDLRSGGVQSVNLQRLNRAWEQTKKRSDTVGPRIMHRYLSAVISGATAPKHSKGVTGRLFEAFGAVQVMGGLPGFSSHYARFMSAITSIDAADLHMKPEILLRQDVRITTPDGKVVEWRAPRSLDELVPMLNPKHEYFEFVKAALSIPVWEAINADDAPSQRILTDYNMQSILGDRYTALFEQKGNRPAASAATLYMAELDSRLGSKEATIATQELGIAFTSAATHVLEDADRQATDAAQSMAEVLQRLAVFAEQHAGGRGLVEMMGKLLTSRARLRAMQKTLGLGDLETIKQYGELIDQSRAQEAISAYEAKMAEIVKLPPSEIDRIPELQAEANAILNDWMDAPDGDTSLEAFTKMFLEGQHVAQVAALYTPDETSDSWKTRILDYIQDNPIIAQQSDSYRAVLAETLNDLHTRSRDELNYIDTKWRDLAEAVAGHHLMNLLDPKAPRVATRGFKFGSDSMRSLDYTFSYLLDPIFKPDSRLLNAAIEVQKDVGSVSGYAHTDFVELLEIVERTIFGTKEKPKVGKWTGHIADVTLEASENLINSIASGPAAGAVGDANKSEAAPNAALRRTNAHIPRDEFLSTATLPVSAVGLYDEGFDPFATGTAQLIQNNPDSTVDVSMIELNQRYVKSITIVDANGDVIEDMTQSAWKDYNDSNWEKHDYRVFSAKRLVNALRRDPDWETRFNGATVVIDYLDIRRQPTEPVWANNRYFQGTEYDGMGSNHPSLHAALHMGQDGLPNLMQRAVFDSVKGDTEAWSLVPARLENKVFELEEGWQQDLYKVIMEKTKLIFEQDLGFGKLQPSWFNTVFDEVLKRHAVVIDGDIYTAQQVIGAQLGNNPELLASLANGRLIAFSDRAFNTALGEPGKKGLSGIRWSPEIDVSKIPTFKGFGEGYNRALLGSLLEGEGTMRETRLQHRTSLRRLRTTQLSTREEVNAFNHRVEFQKENDDKVYDLRGVAARSNAKYSSGKLNQSTIDLIQENVQQNRIKVDLEVAGAFRQGNVDFNAAAEAAFLSAIARVQQFIDEPGRGRVFIYEQSAKGNPTQGILTERHIREDEVSANSVTSMDVVDFRLASFMDQGQTVAESITSIRKALEYLIRRGATIVVNDTGAGTQGSDLLHATMAILRNGVYEPLTGTSRVWRQMPQHELYQNKIASESSWMAMDEISARDRALVFLAHHDSLDDEGSLTLLSNRDPNIRQTLKTSNLVRATFRHDFNLPRADHRRTGSQESQMEEVKTKIARLVGWNATAGTIDTRSPGFEMLLKQAGETYRKPDEELSKERGMTLEAALVNMFSRDSIVPSEGDWIQRGDIIPVTDARGRVILIRYGHAAPDSLEDLFAQSEHDEGIPAGVATFLEKPEEVATAKPGTWLDARWGQNGFSVSLSTPLDLIGDKIVIEYNGMKYTVVPQTDGSFEIYSGAVIAGKPISYGSDRASADAKSAYRDRVDGFGSAWGFFGVDFTERLARAFGRDWVDVEVMLKSLEASQDYQKGSEGLARQAMYTLANTRSATSLQAHLGDLATILPAATDTVWSDFLDSTQVPDISTDTYVALAVLNYLSIPGAKLSDIVRIPGINHVDAEMNPAFRSWKAPGNFTIAFDNLPLDSEIHSELLGDINNNLPWDEASETGVFFAANWDVVSSVNGRQIRGVLQIPEIHSSGDNAMLDDMGRTVLERSGLSLHTASGVYAAMGALPLTPQEIEEINKEVSLAGVPRYTGKETDKAQLWQDFTRVPHETDASFAPWQTRYPWELKHDRWAAEARAGFLKPIDLTDVDPDVRTEYLAERSKVAQRFNLSSAQAVVVDHWVRMFLGRPAGTREQGEEVFMPMHQAMAALKEIMRNAEAGQWPTVGGEVFAPAAEHMELLYNAQHRGGNPVWRLRTELNGQSEFVSSNFADWIHAAWGSVQAQKDTIFDPIYKLAIDGMLNTYRENYGDWVSLPSSLDVTEHLRMLDPNANEATERAENIIARFRSDRNFMLTEQELYMLDASEASFNESLRGKFTASGYRYNLPSEDILMERQKQREEWRAKGHIPGPEAKPYGDTVSQGAAFANEVTTTSNLWKSLQYLRAANGMASPGLWTSSIYEMAFANTRDNIAAGLRGTSIGSLATTAPAQALHRMIGNEVYSADQLNDAQALLNALASSSDWKKMVFEEITWKVNYGKGGRAVAFAENLSRAFGSMQDATAGLRQKRLARTYLEAVLDEMQMRRGIDNMTISQLRTALETNPRWLQQHHPELHNRGLSAIANARHLRETAMSLAVNGVINSAMANPKWYINAPANLLKLPLMFSTFGFNVATNMLGLQGVNASILSAIDSNERAKTFLGQAQAWLKGIEYNPTQFDKDTGGLNLSKYLEGVDISRAYVQAGITHTTLAMLGILLGGLSSEDDEERRRRLAAQYQRGVMQFDPRSIANDFRNADEWFVDWLPFGLDQYFAESDGQGGQTSMAKPNWIMRQFMSPLKGISDFYNSGNPADLIAGFEDALLSFPLINFNSWDNAVATHAALESASQEMNGEGATALSIAKQGSITASIVWGYERMLIENSFLNTLRTHLDGIDRNPYLIPMMEEGEILREEGYGTPLPAELTQRFVDDDGNVTVGYKQRGQHEGGLISRAENNMTFSLIMSMFTGFGDSPYLRRNMVAKDVVEEMGHTSKAEAEAYVLGRMAAFDGMQEASDFEGDTLGGVALSLLDDDGREAVTQDGARAIINALWMGVIDEPTDPALDGVYITQEMRETIQAEWMEELIQEGVDLGLDVKRATSRANRIYWGPIEDPEVKGLRDYLWDRRIPDRADTRYLQLNTTYVMGPDGKPVATGFQRDNLFTALGIAPATRMYTSVDTGMDSDSRANVVDPVTGQNLGRRGLVRTEPSWTPPTQEELFDKLSKDIENALKNLDFSGRRGYARYGRGGGGGGGYAVRPNLRYTNHPNWNNLRLSVPTLRPYNTTDVRPTMTENITLRRAETRRQRISSDRGRLKPWQ